MSEELVQVKNLKKYFTGGYGTLHAVDDITLTVRKGETLGIVGESGCGKSTLGKTILRLIEPTSGQILYDGKDIAKAKKNQLKDLRQDMQMIFQDPFDSLDPRMSVSSLIEEPLKIFNLCNDAAGRAKRVAELMDTVGLATRFKDTYPHEMDGGRRQRIGIARALAVNPRFIVCDEPVSALDVSIQAQVLNLLQDLQEQQGIAYMFITHDMSVVRHISNEICVMYLGQAVEVAEAKALFASTLHPYTKALLSAIPVPSIHYEKKKIMLKGELTSPINPKPGCRFAPRCPYAKPECFETTPQLEEIQPGHQVACHFSREINQLSK